jgi:hypothetical protein
MIQQKRTNKEEPFNTKELIVVLELNSWVMRKENAICESAHTLVLILLLSYTMLRVGVVVLYKMIQ